MRSAMERGKWVFFQNCHLAPSWMPSLERLIEQIDPDKVTFSSTLSDLQYFSKKVSIHLNEFLVQKVILLDYFIASSDKIASSDILEKREPCHILNQQT